MIDAAINNRMISLTRDWMDLAMVEDSDETWCLSSRKDENEKRREGRARSEDGEKEDNGREYTKIV